MSAEQTHASITYPVPVEVSSEGPWRWLNAGWQDLWRNPLMSFGYGFVFVAAGLLMSWGLWSIGLSSMIPVVAGAFAMVGPLMAVGLYEMSRRYETGQSFTFNDIVLVRAKSPLQIAYVGFLIMFGLLVWGRIAIMIYALFVSSTYMPLSQFSAFVLGTPQGLWMLVVGSIVGGILGFAGFAMTAFSIPMLMDRDTDIFTAIAASVHAVVKNRGAMLLWAWLIAIFVAVGIGTAFLGLVLMFPLLGHATWHAYRETFPNR